MAEEGKDNVIEKGREILRILEESKEFTRRLLKENERLRFQNVSSVSYTHLRAHET